MKTIMAKVNVINLEQRAPRMHEVLDRLHSRGFAAAWIIPQPVLGLRHQHRMYTLVGPCAPGEAPDLLAKPDALRSMQAHRYKDKSLREVRLSLRA